MLVSCRSAETPLAPRGLSQQRSPFYAPLSFPLLDAKGDLVRGRCQYLFPNTTEALRISIQSNSLVPCDPSLCSSIPLLRACSPERAFVGEHLAASLPPVNTEI